MPSALPSLIHAFCFAVVFLVSFSKPLMGDETHNDRGAAETLRIWSEREKATETFDVAWKGEVFQLYDIRPMAPAREVARTYFGESRFAVNAEGLARMDGFNPPRDDKRTEGEPVVMTFSGTGTTFFPQGSQGHPFAEISQDAADALFQTDLTIPLRLFYRPFDASFGVFEDRNLVPNETPHTTFRGERCLILDSGRSTVWVTDDERRLPVRYFRRRPGSALNSYDITIDYRDSGGQGWTPAGWNLVRLGIDGTTILGTVKATVTTCAINKPIPAETFTVEFPPGTLVSNLITGERRILREGKPDRIVLPGESTGSNYEQLLNSEPPTVAGPNTEQTIRWLWIGNGGLVLAGILLWFWRSRKIRHAAAKDKVEVNDDV